MIVVDSSALVAIFENEADAATYAQAIAEADRLLISAVNAHETAVVLRARHGEAAAERFWQFLENNSFEVISFDSEQARQASAAFGRFGKGIHSKAKLNLADCAAYALATSLTVPLLFKGDDFTHTDVEQWH